MKSFLSILALVFLAVTVQAAETKKKSPAKAKSEPAEVAKVPAKVDAIAKSLTPTQRTKLLGLLNDGDEAALISIPGIGETRAADIKKARPFNDVTDVTNVSGVGEGTFAEMVAHAKAGFPQAEKKEEPSKSDAKKKEEPKKEEPKKKSTTKK